MQSLAITPAACLGVVFRALHGVPVIVAPVAGIILAVILAVGVPVVTAAYLLSRLISAAAWLYFRFLARPATGRS